MAVNKVAGKTKEVEVNEEVTETGVEGGTEVAVVATEVGEAIGITGFDLSELGFSEEELLELTGMDSIDASEIRIPYATLVQKKNSTTGWVQGDLVLPDGTVLKCFDGEMIRGAAILAVLKVRSYFPEKFDPKNSFICRSLDGIVGADDGAYPGKECAKCEFAQYPAGGGASPCRDQRLLVIALENGSLMHMNISGIGVGAWKDFFSVQLLPLLPKVKNLLAAVRVNIGAKVQDTDFGEFACPVFQVEAGKETFSVDKVRENLNALKSYNAFKLEHLKSAAVATQIQRSVDGDPEAGGQNDEAF